MVSAADPEASSELGLDWTMRAQDGQAVEVRTEVQRTLARRVSPELRVRCLYALAIADLMLGDLPEAIGAARELASLCGELDLRPTGLRARALLVDLLRREGRLEQAVEQLAHAVALESELLDLSDPEVQGALGALAVALRLLGVGEEARRVERRLAEVEHDLPEHQRVARWSNLAFEHAVQAMSAARRPPYRVDGRLLARATEEIQRASALAGLTSYDIVSAEAAVLRALREAAVGDPRVSLRRLEACAGVLEHGPEAITAQLFWATAAVRARVRLGLHPEAAMLGRSMLARIRGSGREGDRLVLAYEVMRAENPDVQHADSGTAAFVALSQERLGHDLALVGALFSARVDLLRGADERRVLARAAALDPLTGLINRRGAATAVADAAARPAREPVALLMIDLDGFKDVNDTHGHQEGDALLQRVSAALRTAARLEDVVARWGGDEFVVVAALDSDRALALAHRLRDTIRDCSGPPSGPAGGLRVTGSIGVAVRTGPVDERSWLRRADEAMYSAKRSGGDATVLG